MSMKETESTQISLAERLLMCLTKPPWHAVYLIPIGFLIFPVFYLIVGNNGSAWALVFVFFGILLSLRIGTAFLRGFLPVSKEVREAWFQTRLLTKHYDSYQWQKLFWVGVGIVIHLALSDRLQGVQIAWAVGCLVAGVIGMIIWRKVGVTDRH
jgi:hypothetical protein